MQKKKIAYRLYDVVEKKDLGIYTGAELSDKIGIEARQISAYAKSRSKVKGRYILERIESVTIKELLEEWDRVTGLFRARKKNG